MDIDTTYAALVDGTGGALDLEKLGPLLFRRALEHTRTPDPKERLGALRVAAVLGPELALPVIRALVDDPDERVRTWAFNQAVAARDAGVAVLRDAAHGRDPALVAAALDLLELRMDRASAGVGRRGLDNPHPRVRLAAARLLGRVAGPAVTVQLRQAAERDADPDVRAAATEALQRIAGETDRGEPRAWWDEDLAPAALPAPRPDADEPPAPAWVARAAQPRETETRPDPQPPRALPVPAPSPEPDETLAWDGRHTPLPAQMPTEARALIRLLGMVGRADRPQVLSRLSSGDLGDLLGSWRAGGDEALGRGLALAAAGLGRAVALTRVRHMAGDPQPGVRAAVAEAIGALGAASTLPSMTQLVADPEPRVRAAAIRSLARMAVRLGRRDYARDHLKALGEQPEPVATALADALAELDA